MKLESVRSMIAILLVTCFTCWGQQKRKLIIDQDAAGPGGTDQQSILLLIQSPRTEVLGITVVTGDAWLKSEVDRKSTRLNSSHSQISYAVFCLKKKKQSYGSV